MIKQVFSKAFKTTKATNAILTKTGSEVFKISLGTAKKMAGLYKEAGQEAFAIGKKVVKSSVQLAVENQKEIFKWLMIVFVAILAIYFGEPGMVQSPYNNF